MIQYIKRKLKIMQLTFANRGKNLRIGKNLTVGGIKHIEIGNNVLLSDNIWLEIIEKYKTTTYPKASIRIGDNTGIGRNAVITAINEIVIGNNCLFGPNVYISDHFHGNNSVEQIEIPVGLRDLFTKGKVVIEDNVWIGYGVSILPNVTIGRCSIIGANSVVTKDVEPYTVVAGNPAKIIRKIK
jgi:acetyltransferase-like isoleucine patch superfamily enzyme